MNFCARSTRLEQIVIDGLRRAESVRRAPSPAERFDLEWSRRTSLEQRLLLAMELSEMAPADRQIAADPAPASDFRL